MVSSLKFQERNLNVKNTFNFLILSYFIILSVSLFCLYICLCTIHTSGTFEQ